MSPKAGDRIILYCRVSTEEQASSGLGLEAQEAKGRAYAALYGLELVDVVIDAGVSAKSLDRPGLREALAKLDDRQADGLLVAKLDRLTRSVRDLGALIDDYFGEKRGLRLLAVDDQIDTKTAGGRLVLNVLASVSQWEREVIGERTRAALAVKKARGERAGATTYGMRVAADGAHTRRCKGIGCPGCLNLDPDPTEQGALAIIRELRAAGLGPHRIIQELTKAGVPPRGSKWHLTSVQRILAVIDRETAHLVAPSD